MPQKIIASPDEVQKIVADPSQVSAPSDYSEQNPPGASGGMWAQALDLLKNIGIGSLKQTGKIAMTPARMMGDIGVPGFTSSSYKGPYNLPGGGSMDLEPSGIPQKVGAGGVELASYLAPAAKEAEAANLVRGAMVKGLGRGLISGYGKPAAGAMINAASALPAAAIGGAVAGGTAYANQEDPVAAAKWGAAIPGAVTAARPLVTGAGGMAKDWARNAMARAIEPGSKVDKWTAKNILDRLLEEGRVWWTSKGLGKMAREEINAATADKAAARASLGQNPEMMYDDVEKALQQARDTEFRSGRSAQGAPMSNIPSESRAASAYDEFMRDYIMPKVRVDQATGERYIPFDELDLTKRSAQNYAASHGPGFLDLPRDMPTSTEADVERVVSNAARPQLEDFAGSDWANANKRLHANIAINQLAEERMGKKLGQKVPLAERGVGGYGWHMGGAAPTAQNEIPGMLTRYFRRLVDSPGWQSTTAQMKDWIANRLLGATGYKTGGAAADIASQSPGREEPLDLSGQPDLAIGNTPSGQEYIWMGPGKIQPKQ